MINKKPFCRYRQEKPFDSNIYVIEHRRNTKTYKRYIFANDLDSENLMPDLEINLNYASIFTYEEMVYMVNLLEIKGTPLNQIKVKKVEVEEITLATIKEAKMKTELKYLIGKIIPNEKVSKKLQDNYPNIMLFYNKLKEKVSARSGTLFQANEIENLMSDGIVGQETVIIKI